MKAVILNGSLGPDHDSCDDLCERLDERLRARGVETERFDLRELALAHCVGCFACWVETPGKCTTHDRSHDIARAVVNADIRATVSPVTFGGFSSQAKKIIDRLICMTSPFFTKVDGEVHHRPRYDRYPAKLDVGELARPDPEAAEVFRTLSRRNAINAHAPVNVAALVTAGDEPQAIEAELERAIAELLAGLEEVAA